MWSMTWMSYWSCLSVSRRRRCRVFLRLDKGFVVMLHQIVKMIQRYVASSSDSWTYRFVISTIDRPRWHWWTLTSKQSTAYEQVHAIARYNNNNANDASLRFEYNETQAMKERKKRKNCCLLHRYTIASGDWVKLFVFSFFIVRVSLWSVVWCMMNEYKSGEERTDKLHNQLEWIKCISRRHFNWRVREKNKQMHTHRWSEWMVFTCVYFGEKRCLTCYVSKIFNNMKCIRECFIYILFFFITDSNFVLGNAQVANVYPIVYCSDGFCELTGFPRAQIMQKGCACLFLIGPETQEEHIKQIENALDTKSELKLEVTFYKSSGEYWLSYLR